MKTINESELDVALDKLEAIRRIANEFSNKNLGVISLAMNTILEVIDE